MAFYISGPKLLFETTEISTHPNSTQQESNYIHLYTTKFGTSIKIRLNRKFESTEFETMRVNCIVTFCPTYIRYMNQGIYIYCDFLSKSRTSLCINIYNLTPVESNSDESKFRLSRIKVLVPRCRKPYYLHC